MVIIFTCVEDFTLAQNLITEEYVGVALGSPNTADDGRCAACYPFTEEQVNKIQTLMDDNGISVVLPYIPESSMRPLGGRETINAPTDTHIDTDITDYVDTLPEDWVTVTTEEGV